MNRVDHRYLDDIEHREEGGTPAIIESIRAGLVFRLKNAVGQETIEVGRVLHIGGVDYVLGLRWAPVIRPPAVPVMWMPFMIAGR